MWKFRGINSRESFFYFAVFIVCEKTLATSVGVRRQRQDILYGEGSDPPSITLCNSDVSSSGESTFKETFNYLQQEKEMNVVHQTET